MHTVFLSLGTNLGDKERNLNDAIAHIQRRIGTVVAKSAFVQTEPWGFESDNSFLNAAIKVETIQSPEQVLHQTQEIERMLVAKLHFNATVMKVHVLDSIPLNANGKTDYQGLKALCLQTK